MDNIDLDDLGTAWDWFWDCALAFILIGLVVLSFFAADLLTNKTDDNPQRLTRHTQPFNHTTTESH